MRPVPQQMPRRGLPGRGLGHLVGKTDLCGISGRRPCRQAEGEVTPRMRSNAEIERVIVQQLRATRITHPPVLLQCIKPILNQRRRHTELNQRITAPTRRFVQVFRGEMVVVKGMACELVRNWGAALRAFRALVNHVEADPGLCPTASQGSDGSHCRFYFRRTQG
jgi:hypothetical protein